MTGRLMLEHKGIAYRRVDLIPALHKPALRALRFGATTVPALRVDGRPIQGTLEISRALDELVPQAPLFPGEAGARRRVEEAERWGEGVLQPVPRRLSWWAVRRRPSDGRSFLEGARLGLPIGVAAVFIRPVAAIEAAINAATDDSVQADLTQLPALLDHVDELVSEGVLGGAEPNAADFQIATSVALLASFDDLRPGLDGRAGLDLARGLVPEFPGRVGPVFPASWLEPLRSSRNG